MIIFFEEKDLVSFGEYVLSEERTNKILDSEELNGQGFDALKTIYQDDVASWANLNRSE